VVQTVVSPITKIGGSHPVRRPSSAAAPASAALVAYDSRSSSFLSGHFCPLRAHKQTLCRAAIDRTYWGMHC
jgi:hypothetical protein